MVRLPNVPLFPPIELVPLKVMLPDPVVVCVALFVSVPVTVTVLPPSLNVPEVSVSVGMLGSAVVPVLGKDKLSVPALLFTTTAFKFEMTGAVPVAALP